MQLLFILLALLAGMSVAIQPLLNATASAMLGHPLWGAIASAAVTFLVLLGAVLALRVPLPPLRMQGFGSPPVWLYGGGLIGALMLFVGLFVAPKLGIATTVALFIGGQLAAALVIDQFGWLGVPQHPVSITRVFGAVFLTAGVVLIRTS
jgi:bacterial/archaeal transporter family-2 protein